MLSLLVWTKVITLRGFYYLFVYENEGRVVVLQTQEMEKSKIE